jgi:hypothetical protein
VVFRLLAGELAGRGGVPGILSREQCERFPSLRQALEETDAALFLSCFGPYVIGPAIAVRCDEETLLQLARDLADREDKEPEQWRKARLAYYCLPPGERIWGMDTGDERHGRYTGALWIAPLFLSRDFGPSIAAVLAGRAQRL